MQDKLHFLNDASTEWIIEAMEAVEKHGFSETCHLVEGTQPSQSGSELLFGLLFTRDSDNGADESRYLLIRAKRHFDRYKAPEARVIGVEVIGFTQIAWDMYLNKYTVARSVNSFKASLKNGKIVLEAA